MEKLEYLAFFWEKLRRKPRILLVEDNEKIREDYRKSLMESGFDVMVLPSGVFIQDSLHKEKFDVVLCDSDMPRVQGYIACRRAMSSGVLSEDVMLIGMSDDSDNQEYWRGLAHDFYDKGYVQDMGESIRSRFFNFLNQAAWRERMPKIQT